MLTHRTHWLLTLLLVVVGFVPIAAQAKAITGLATCHAEASLQEPYSAIAAMPDRWKCDGRGWSLASEVTFIRFEPGAGQAPRSLTTNAGNFERMDVGLVDRRGGEKWSSWVPNGDQHLSAGPFMSLPLDRVDAGTRFVVVRVVRPWGNMILSEMKLDSDARGSGWPLGRLVFLAAICGMLLVPLLFNIAFYSVLPERYVIWHIIMVAAMLVQATCANGFIHFIADLPPVVEWQISNMAFMTMASAALMFSATFIERGKIDPRLSSAAQKLACALLAIGAVLSIQIEALRPFSSGVLHGAILLAILLIALTMFDAWRRGSKAVCFQIAGWTPILLIGTYRIAAYVKPELRATETMAIYQLAQALEVILTAMGIITRFLDVRHERDFATARALQLEGEAGCDPLTGLRNRRSLERRFAELHRLGFHTMAAIDLDHFKSINDTYGHARGDIVLRAAAAALSDDRDTKAFRIGGEEFLMLLRGPDAIERAERCRRAISVRVAAQVQGLDHLVTASMGLVTTGSDGTSPPFETMYAHCDSLLYDAKRLGRNRSVIHHPGQIETLQSVAA